MQFPQKSYWTILGGIILLHFLINVIPGIFFFLDDVSVGSQLTHSIIHFGFILITIIRLYPIGDFSQFTQRVGLLIVGIFILFNLIPFSQGYLPHDNGFVPLWTQVPQINLGWPLVFFRYFGASLVLETGPYLVHPKQLFLNGYILTIGLAIGLRVLEAFKLKLQALRKS